MVFDPSGKAPAGTLNFWRGWAVDPDPDGDCSLFLDHVRNVICCGDEDHASYVLGWLADMVQRPGRKPGVALVLKGLKGAGKDAVAEYVAGILGRRHCPTIAQPDHLTGRFNALMESALMVQVQEGFWAGDRKAESVLKYLVTSPHLSIERKGIDTIDMPSVLRLFVSANAEWVVPASEDERRWAVFNVSSERVGNRDYFDALYAEMEGNGPAALLHYLKHYDLSGFDVRRPPETAGLRDQKLASLRNVERWWFDTLCRGDIALPFGDLNAPDWSKGTMQIGRDELREDYESFLRKNRYQGESCDPARFGQKLRAMLPSLEDVKPRVNGRQVRRYRIPTLPKCREEFSAWIGSPIVWGD